MTGTLYLFGVTVALLLALAVTLPVIRNIVLEGLERRREWKDDEIERDPTDKGATTDAHSSEEGTDGSESQCQHCGAVNESKYRFCEECAEPL